MQKWYERSRSVTLKQQTKFQKNQVIKISMWQSIYIKFLDAFFCFNNRSNKLLRLYNRGRNRMDKEMDIVKIIKNLRNMGIFMKFNKNHDQFKVLKY